jgi:propionyl-CoA carboxylase alpha chain
MTARFATLLVANRGEIASRVFRTARATGLRCVAVYVAADADAPFVAAADEAVRLPDGGYLDGPSIIAAARATGAGAIHPGYGFLSENADFAAAVAEAGLVWVGPPATAIDAMGDKLAAKRTATEAGVPTLPSSDDPRDGDAVGYPLLVKAAAGGGGKGMRVVESADGLAAAVAAAQGEARRGFGDDRVFLERYVPRARHVEIQVLADGHGGVLHLGERECSIQRRHQKIVEESPSPAIDAPLRAAMGEAALRLVRAIDYRSAGTVEFLVDDDSREFFFLEMNTRLQVEHPVTEAVTGLDLVREQLRIAAGEPLGYSQAAVSFGGHAIEARLYAEDPAAGYLPATGTLAAFVPPADPAVRWETGVATGTVVGLDFDPMLAKVIAHAPTRAEAAGRLALALQRLHVGGVTTNRDLLVAVLRSPAFLAGDTTTDFLDRVRPPVATERDDAEVERVAMLAALWLQGAERAGAPVLGFLPSGFRVGRLPPERVGVVVEGRELDVRYRRRRDGSFAVTVAAPGEAPGPEVAGVVRSWSSAGLDAELGSRRVVATVTSGADRLWIQAPSGTVAIQVRPRFAPPEPPSAAGDLVAPMPGVVLDVRCAPGDRVGAGQVLVVLEAMKMEHHVRAPFAGTVAAVPVAPGHQIGTGAVLLVLEADRDGDGDG